jgi:hypothetical protein
MGLHGFRYGSPGLHWVDGEGTLITNKTTGGNRELYRRSSKLKKELGVIIILSSFSLYPDTIRWVPILFCFLNVFPARYIHFWACDSWFAL